MSLQLITTPGGLIALVVRNHLIIHGDTADDSGVMVQTAADNLSTALGYSVNAVREDLSFEDLIARYVDASPAPAAPAVCAKCGTSLNGQLCHDLTCPYSSWPQQVSLEDIHTLSADELAIKYELIRAEAHSDDHVIERPFFANDWFVAAQDVDIIVLAADEWGRSDVADSVARHFDGTSPVSSLFDYLSAKNALRTEVGFECTVNPKDALAWLRRHRHGLWAHLKCGEHEVRLTEATEPEIEGMWDWIGPAGDACDHSFNSADEAAVDAVKKLGLDPGGPVIPLYLGFWDISAFHSATGKDSRLIIGPAMFCEALGYSDEDIADIRNLAVGETWESPDFGPCHTVCRIR